MSDAMPGAAGVAAPRRGFCCVIHCRHGNDYINPSILVARLILAACFHSFLQTMPPVKAALLFLHLLF